MTPSLKELALTDHPFDEIAVEAAAKAYLRAKNNITTDAAWEATMPGLKQTALDFQTVALTAACKSMKERGRARDGKGYDLPRETPPSDWAVWTDKKPGFENECFPVTIFRHGE